MRHMLIKLIATSALLLSQSSWAELSGNQLLDLCSGYSSNSDIDNRNSVGCLYYIQGVLDGKRIGYFAGYLGGRIMGVDKAKIMVDKAKNTKTLEIATKEAYLEEAYLAKAAQYDSGFCAYGSQALEQYAKVIVNFLKDHPETNHFQASTQIDLALSKAFPLPCNK